MEYTYILIKTDGTYLGWSKAGKEKPAGDGMKWIEWAKNYRKILTKLNIVIIKVNYLNRCIQGLSALLPAAPIFYIDNIAAITLINNATYAIQIIIQNGRLYFGLPDGISLVIKTHIGMTT